jgi:hypothetical protein
MEYKTTRGSAFRTQVAIGASGSNNQSKMPADCWFPIILAGEQYKKYNLQLKYLCS